MALFRKDELKRKTFHILTLIYIGAYYFFSARLVIIALALLVLVVIVGEIMRKKNAVFNKWILKILGGVHRDEEVNKISGLPWTLLGSLLVMVLFKDKDLVLVTLLYMAFGDAIAALVGKTYGKHRILGKKTLEGSASCLVVCFFIGIAFFDCKIAFVSALFMTVIELIPWPLNDNFWIPVLTASFIHLIA